jgi:hypothetical protein
MTPMRSFDRTQTDLLAISGFSAIDNWLRPCRQAGFALAVCVSFQKTEEQESGP